MHYVKSQDTADVGNMSIPCQLAAVENSVKAVYRAFFLGAHK